MTDELKFAMGDKHLNKIKLKEAKDYLSSTDYIVVKISEAMIEGNTTLVEQLKTNYATELAKRAEMREVADSLSKK